MNDMTMPAGGSPADQTALAANSGRGTETRDLPMQHRGLTIRPGSWDDGARTVDVVFSTGARRAMLRWRGWDADIVDEELSMDPAAIRMDRINRGGPVLNSHSRYSLEDQIGVVVDGSARIEGGEAVATLRLSSRAEIAGIVQDIRDGIIRNISVGYMVHRYDIAEREGERPLYRAEDWEPTEISFVPVPADAGAGSRSTHDSTARDGDANARQGGFPCVISRAASPAAASERKILMPEEVTEAGTETPVTQANEVRAPAPAPAAPPAPAAVTAARILDAANRAGLDETARAQLLDAHAAQPMGEERLMAEIGRRFAERDEARTPQTGGRRVLVNETDKVRNAVQEAIEHRIGITKEFRAGGEEFRGLSLIEIGREMLGRAGVSTRGLAPAEVIGQMQSRAFHVSGDFPLLLANVANKVLLSAFEAERPFMPFVEQIEVSDFKAMTLGMFGDAPRLREVTENAEIKHGTISEDAEFIKLRTFASALSLSRQAIINDDLEAFMRVPTAYGEEAARLDADLIYTDILMGNPNLRTGGALFQNAAARGFNLAGSGAAINVTSLGAGRAVMRKQVGLDGKPLEISPAYLVVGPDKQTEADQVVTAVTPRNASDVNPFSGRLEVGVNSRITGNTWFLASTTGGNPAIVMARLRGSAAPKVEQSEEFDVLGVKFRCYYDVAAVPANWRKLYRNPGA